MNSRMRIAVLFAVLLFPAVAPAQITFHDDRGRALVAADAKVEPIVTGEFIREMQAALVHARLALHRDNFLAGNPPYKTMPIRSRDRPFSVAASSEQDSSASLSAG